jgi:hypothetical protein
VAADTDTDARAARRGAVEARRAGRGSTAAAGRKAALASGGAGDAIGRAGAAAVHCAREGPGERDGAARTGGRDTGPRKRGEESLAVGAAAGGFVRDGAGGEPRRVGRRVGVFRIQLESRELGWPAVRR